MRPAEYTTDAIIQAGQELQASGRNVTGFALRQKVGGGNPNRLKQIWDEHLASQTAAKAEPVAELPVEVAEQVAVVTTELTQRLSALATELNDKAVKAAERRVAEVVRAAGEQRAQAERELADASQTVEDLENKLDESKSEAEALEKRLSDLLEAHQAQAVELAQVRERLAITEQAAKTTAEDHAAELARLNASIEAERSHHQEQVEQIRADLAEQKQLAKDVAGERDRVQSELAKVAAKAESAEHTHADERKRAAQEAHRTAEKVVRLESERDEAMRDASKAREDAAKQAGELEALRAILAQFNAKK